MAQPSKETATPAADDKPPVTDTQPQPPKGMTQADTDLDAQPKWDFDVNPLIQGEVTKIKLYTDRSEEIPRDVRYAIVITTDGEEVQLWESKNLEQFFNNLKVGSNIWVLYKGSVPLKGRKTMKMFDAYYS